MTIKIPVPGIADKMIKLIGKKRGVALPSGESEKLGPYTYTVAKKENLLKALLRPGSSPLPDGLIDIQTFNSQNSFFGKDNEKKT